MLHKNTLFYFLALIVLAFTACNEPTPIGDEFIDDADLLNATFTDTLSLDVRIAKDTSASAIDGSNVLIGRLDDPIFGTSTANLYLQLAPSLINNFVTGVDLDTDTLEFATDSTLAVVNFSIAEEDYVVLDSLILSLDYANDRSIYGDTISNQNQSFNLFSLEESLNDAFLDSTNTNIYAHNVNFATGENYGLYDVIYNPAVNYFETTEINDTLIDTTLYNPQIRWRLPDALGQTFLDAISSSENNFLENDSVFLANFNGIYIQSSNNNTATANIDLTNSYMRLYYSSYNNYTTEDGNDTVAIRNQSVFFDASGGGLLHAKQYLHDYSGTEVETVLNNAGQVTDLGYMQGMVGLQTYVSVPNIEALGDIIVHKAELELTNVENIERLDTLFMPPTQLASLLYDETNDELFFPSFDIVQESLLNISTDTTTSDVYNQYTVSKTFDTQKIVLEPSENYSYYIVPRNKLTNPNRLVYQGPENELQPLKLNLYYSKINE